MGSASFFLIVGYDEQILMNDRRNAKAMPPGYASQIFFPKKYSVVIVCGCLQFRSLTPNRVHPIIVESRSARGKAVVAVSLMGLGIIGTGPFDFSTPGIYAENCPGLPFVCGGIEKDAVPPDHRAAMTVSCKWEAPSVMLVFPLGWDLAVRRAVPIVSAKARPVFRC